MDVCDCFPFWLLGFRETATAGNEENEITNQSDIDEKKLTGN